MTVSETIIGHRRQSLEATGWSLSKAQANLIFRGDFPNKF
jgi:hypothetical protein